MERKKRRGTIQEVVFELSAAGRADNYSTTYTIGRRVVPVQFVERRLGTRDPELIAWLDTVGFCKRVHPQIPRPNPPRRQGGKKEYGVPSSG